MSISFTDVFSEISVLLLISVCAGALAVRLRQPVLVAFIAVGILAGPSGLDIMKAFNEVDLLARMGIALLLFLVGLKLDIKIIRTLGPVALVAGLTQVAFTAVFGLVIALWFGLTMVHAAYVAVAMSFSSTIIIVKLLSDKRELEDLHGRLAIGLLIVQDIVVIAAMIVLTAMAQADGSMGVEALEVLAGGAVLFGGIALCVRYVLTPVLRLLARSPELLVLFAIAWALGLGTLSVSLGLSKELGAFAAGVALGSTPYRDIVGARLVPLRDFLLLFFFLNLGYGLDLANLGDEVLPAIVLSLFVLLGKPFIVLVVLGLMGYRKQTSFRSGLILAQISEFSLILGALGLQLGHIDADTLGLITLVGLITIAASNYLILYSDALFARLSPLLDVFQRNVPFREMDEEDDDAPRVDVVVFGLGRLGSRVVNRFRHHGWNVLGIDADPHQVRKLGAQGVPAALGDMESPDYLAHLHLENIRLVVSCVPRIACNLALQSGLAEQGYTGHTVLLAEHASDRELLLEGGHCQVLVPHDDVALGIVDSLLSQVGDLEPASADTDRNNQPAD